MRIQRVEFVTLCVVLLLATAFTVVLHSAVPVAGAEPDAPAAAAAIPTTFNYQGILRGVDGSLITGERDMTFKIYDSVIGGTELHSETITGVAVRDGIFNVVLGDATPISSNVFADAPRFLGITVAPDPEMVPRQRLHPVPWAVQATTALQANQASTASQSNQANVATTLVQNATVTGLTANGLTVNSPGLLIPGYNSFRIDGPPDPQTAPYFSMGGYGAFQIDAVGIYGGRFIVTNDGNVGIGNASPAYKLDVAGKVRATSGFNGACNRSVYDPGAVGLGIDVVCNQDVAEAFASDEATEPGDVVVLLPQSGAEPAVRLAREPYAELLAGVVSTNPGLVFDHGATYLAGNNADLITAEKTVVAMIGRVPVRFALENGPIAVGDPLTSSSQVGAAMKATQAGPIIGYALQSSDAAAKDGKLLAWLQVGYYIPGDQLARLNSYATPGKDVAELASQAAALEAEVAGLEAANAALEARIAALERGGATSGLPLSLPLAGGLVVLGLVFGVRLQAREGQP